MAFALPDEAQAEHAARRFGGRRGRDRRDRSTERRIAPNPTSPSSPTRSPIFAGTLDRSALEAGVARGTVLGEAVNFARLMALTPGNDMTPTHMAERAPGARPPQAGLEFDVLDEARDGSEGDGFAARRLARLRRTRHALGHDLPRRSRESKEVLALVGKGLTFDSGGISIKPAETMHEMKYDMSRRRRRDRARCTRSASSNRSSTSSASSRRARTCPGRRAMKPGDILRAMNGKTIEVINTDAEGRLILADALCYARELGATKIVDAATLTGACVIALGHAASGVMSNDDAFVERFLKVVGDVGERYWRLPLYDDFDRQIKSDIADIKNTGGRPGRRGNGRGVPQELRRRRAVDPPRHRRDGVSRQRVVVSGQRSDRNAGARVRRAGRRSGQERFARQR